MQRTKGKYSKVPAANKTWAGRTERKSRRENKTITEIKITSKEVQKRIMIAEATAWDMDFKIWWNVNEPGVKSDYKNKRQETQTKELQYMLE